MSWQRALATSWERRDACPWNFFSLQALVCPVLLIAGLSETTTSPPPAPIFALFRHFAYISGSTTPIPSRPAPFESPHRTLFVDTWVYTVPCDGSPAASSSTFFASIFQLSLILKHWVVLGPQFFAFGVPFQPRPVPPSSTLVVSLESRILCCSAFWWALCCTLARKYSDTPTPLADPTPICPHHVSIDTGISFRYIRVSFRCEQIPGYSRAVSRRSWSYVPFAAYAPRLYHD